MASKRDAKFVQLRNNGFNNADIAKKYGISRERVRQILAKLNYAGKPDLLYKQKTAEEAEEQRKRRVKAIHAWQKRNPDKRTIYNRKYTRQRLETDLDFKMRKRLARRLRDALQRFGGEKSKRTMDLIGCSVQELREHLEKQFQPGMTWENWSISGWHIDHIRPCASFDLTDPIQQAQCFHYTNLQPLWAKDNMIKKDYWEGNLNETCI